MSMEEILAKRYKPGSVRNSVYLDMGPAPKDSAIMVLKEFKGYSYHLNKDGTLVQDELE